MGVDMIGALLEVGGLDAAGSAILGMLSDFSSAAARKAKREGGTRAKTTLFLRRWATLRRSANR